MLGVRIRRVASLARLRESNSYASIFFLQTTSVCVTVQPSIFRAIRHLIHIRFCRTSDQNTIILSALNTTRSHAQTDHLTIDGQPPPSLSPPPPRHRRRHNSCVCRLHQSSRRSLNATKYKMDPRSLYLTVSPKYRRTHTRTRSWLSASHGNSLLISHDGSTMCVRHTVR